MLMTHLSFRKPQSGYPESVTTVRSAFALLAMDSGFADFVRAPE